MSPVVVTFSKAIIGYFISVVREGRSSVRPFSFSDAGFSTGEICRKFHGLNAIPPLPDQRHLDAADGWLGPGDFQSAGEERDQSSPDLRAHPHVLELRHQIYAATGAFPVLM
jgi:hypothetical protein